MIFESPRCHRIVVSALALVALGICVHVDGAPIAKPASAGLADDTTTTPATRVPATRETARKAVRTQALSPRSTVRSRIAMVVDASTSEELLVKNASKVVPIASITKLMTAMVVLDARQPMEEKLTISNEDRDLVMGTGSRLHVGWALSREDMLHLALMSSENRAAAALSRYYPGGRPAFIAAMNAKARTLGMTSTHFVNANGLTAENLSTASDLVKLVRAASTYPLIREFTTDPGHDVRIGRHLLHYINSNRLVGRPGWDIEVQKTGFTNEAGDCLVMQVRSEGRPLIMVFLDGNGKLTRFADAHRVIMQLALLPRKPTVAGSQAATTQR